MSQLPQVERIHRHLLAGRTITPLEALGVFGVYRLGARIHELRKRGVNIQKTIEVDQYGRQYAKYYIPRNDHDAGGIHLRDEDGSQGTIV